MRDREEHIGGLPLVQYWHSEQVPDYIVGHLETFCELNPDLRHLVFNESSGAAFIDKHFGRRQLRAFQSCAVPAMQADYFRYCATLVLGGVYCDADVLCVAGMRPLIPAIGGGRLFQRPNGKLINGLFAFGSPGHAFIELALEIATTNIERRISSRVYFTTGPPIFDFLLLLHRLGSIEALADHVKGQRLRNYVHLYWDAINDYIHVTHALKGIRLSSIAESRDFVCAPKNKPLPYKRTDAHWTNFEGEIFRKPPD